MLLQANGINKQYQGTEILQHVSIELKARDRIGLLGVNGAGKSTFLEIIAGEASATSGEINIARETTIGYLPQHTQLDSPRTIWEEACAVFAHLQKAEQQLRQLELQMADPKMIERPSEHEKILKQYANISDLFKDQGGYEYEANIRKVLHGIGFAEVDFTTPIQQLSGGQKTRLALAKLLLKAPDILLLDEPTNHLDIDALAWLEQYLHEYDGAIILISHDRYFLDALIHQVVEIEHGRSKRYTGNYSRFIQLKSEDLEQAQKRYEKQQQDIARMEEFVQRNIARASTSKRAQSRRKALERIEPLERPISDDRQAKFRFDIERRTGRNVLTVEHLSVSYGEEPLLTGLTFALERGERLAIIGPNGVGKSSLLKTLIGRLPPFAGSFKWGSNVLIGYYDQEQADLHPDKTVLAELWDAFPLMEERKIRTILGQFLFSGEDVLKRISSLSGGERARVALAKLMLLNANVLVLDEPTNHLDLKSREVLEEALADFAGTIIFISHDRYFLNKIADRIVECSPDKMNHFLGNYDHYVEKKKEQAQIAAETEQTTQEFTPQPLKQAKNDVEEAESGADLYEAEKKAKQQERQRKRKLKQLEADIQAYESKISELEKKLALPEIYQDYTALQEINDQIAGKKEKLSQIYAEWEELLD